MPLSVKTKEHFRRRMALAGPKWGALAGGAAALAGVIAFTMSALHFVTVSDTHGGSIRLVTVNQNPAAVLAQAGVAPLGENDRLVTTETPDGVLLQVLRAYTVQVTADGRTQEIITTGATTRDLLTQAGLTYTAEDYLTPAADETVQEGENITLQRVSYVEYTAQETVPSKVEQIPTSLLYRKRDKVQTVQEGTDGLDTVTYRETWVDGEQVSTDEIGRETQIGMIPTIQKVYGEQVPVSQFVGPDIVDGAPSEGVAEVYTNQRSTAYSASATAKGASGRRLTYGTVAVNPDIIPYGSLLYITSDDGQFVYGYAYAADTGTAMMTGHAFIDLYYETYEESVDNAVIPVTVYVLDDETAAKYQETNDAILEADTTVGR
ncbi:MAG: ubiquitin-like domain-containing protein [Gemmiger sp.]|uniref:ubiquitin-like domain-containing protein n=1 Tax=Gemmiger sp. TaxID=2049027 RepID=UPI002A909CC7|nr:ubiquitin-like domain-containing protein [Gemmiger sp.]MDY5202735.1 ubiquitin-like domain-containing protein [Gemmiger sp.]